MNRLAAILCCFTLMLLLPVAQQVPVKTCYAQVNNAKEEESLFVAKKAFEDGFYEVSIGLLERFLKNYPASSRKAEVELLIARSLFQQNKYSEALSRLEGLLDQKYAGRLEDAVLYWLAETHFKGNNLKKAADYYKQITERFPNSAYVPASYYSLGWCLFQEGKFAEACGYFKIVEDRYPKESQAQDSSFKTIECLYNLKDYPGLREKAMTHLKTYSRDGQRLEYVNFYLAEAEYYLNNVNEAVNLYSKAIASTKDVKLKALCGLGMGWSYIKLKRYDDAQRSLEEIKAAQLDDRSRYILMLAKATLLTDTGRSSEARELYDKILDAGLGDQPILLEAYSGKANALYNLSSYEEAVNTYKEALKKEWGPGIATDLVDKLHYGLAWAYLKQGEFREGIKEFQKIVKGTDDKIIKVSALCQIGDAYQDSGDYEKARETYNAILIDYPDSFYGDYVQYQLGISMLKSSNYDAAITMFLALKNNFPGSKLLDEGVYALGLAYFQKQDYNASREVFEGFQADFKDSSLKPQALYLLGSSFFNLGKYPEAITAFENVMKKFGQDNELMQKAEYEIADCYYQMGQEEEALKRFKSLRTKYPQSGLTAEVIWWLGEYYYRHNDLDVSKRYFSSLINDFGQSNLLVDAYYVLGSILAEEGRFGEAIEKLNMVVSLSGADSAAKASIAIADIHLRQGSTDYALNSYKDVLSSYPNFAHIIYPKMADIYFKLGNYREALDYYRKSLEMAPLKEMPVLQFKIAEVLQAQNMFHEAVEEYLKVTYLHGEDDSLNVKALLRVAQIHESREKFREALAVYRKVISSGAEESKYAEERVDWITANTKYK